MRNWLIKLLGGNTDPGTVAEYSAGFADGHAVGFKAGEVAEGRRNTNAAFSQNLVGVTPRQIEKACKKQARSKTKKKKK